MSSNADVFSTVPLGRRERPWLLPFNRKLRHLQGISVRNLTITPPPSSRPRGKTIDDENLPYALKSPAKALAQSESRGIQHSRSSTDLSDLSSKTDLTPSDTQSIPGNQDDGPGAAAGTRPSMLRRRRSTLQWTGASPMTRQKKLEDVTAGRMVDTWFSLHVDGVDEPVYISEVVEKAMNPSFRFFDLEVTGPLVTRLNEVTVKFWARMSKKTEYMLLVEIQVNLRSLQFIGKSLETFRHPLPANSMIFHLTDGIYTSFTDLPPSETPPSFSLPLRTPRNKIDARQPQPELTSSYDALMRLANLDDCIQDALATRSTLESQINSILASTKKPLDTITSASMSQEYLQTTRRAITTERKNIRFTTKKLTELRSSLESRRGAMSRGRQLQSAGRAHLESAQRHLHTTSANLLTECRHASTGQIRRITEDLLHIFPIDPVPDKPLSFTIRSLPLPNSSSLSSSDPETLSAALGHVTQLVYLLSFYLSIPLPYPVKPFSSRSFIQDPIASTIPANQRIYPLYPGVQFRFEYGLFLLNKDIEFLLGRQGLRILDPRQTLPNLKYLLYVLTAGTGDLPARKAGGVRGLLAGCITPALSRRGSEDSVASSEGSATIVPTSRPMKGSDNVTITTSTATTTAIGNGGLSSLKGKGKEKVTDELVGGGIRSGGNASISPTRSNPTTTLPLRSSGLRKVR